jgi:hypothetical protein
VFLCLLLPLFSATLAFAKPGFSEKHECDYNIFNPILDSFPQTA